MSPSGGAGRGQGRKRMHPEGQPRPRRTQATTISLYPDEIEQLTKLLQELGGMERSEFVRRSIRHGWIFKLTDAQLEALRTLAGLAEGTGHE